jgi:hypothetical protein
MQTPWRLTLGGEPLPVEPDPWLFAPGAWAEVEAALGTPLPADYKALIGDGGAWVFGDELLITSPFDPEPGVNLVRHVAGCSWGLVYLRAHDPTFSVAAYPEAGGLFAWGMDGGGGVYHWDTAHADPDQWTICIEGRPIDGVERHALGLMAYLDALRRGAVPAAGLSYWPPPDATLRRMVL